MIDFKNFLEKNKDTIFVYYKYVKVYTPYELDKKFSDESIYENGGYPVKVKILDAIVLPNKDILLKMEDVEYKAATDSSLYIYEKLSDIILREYEKYDD